MGENQHASIGFRRKVLRPFLNQSILRFAPGLSEFNGTMRLVSLERASWFAVRRNPGLRRAAIGHADGGPP